MVDRGHQAVLVVLDGEHVVGVPLEEVAGMAGLGVERVGGHDLAFKVHALQQRAEPGDFVGLGVDPALGQDRP